MKNLFQIFPSDGRPAGDDGEVTSPHGLGLPSLVKDLLGGHKGIDFDSGFVMGGLSTERTILRTTSGFGIDNSTELCLSAFEVIANSAGFMEEEGQQGVFNLQKASRRRRADSSLF